VAVSDFMSKSEGLESTMDWSPTRHSRQRLREWGDEARSKALQAKLNARDFIGLPRQSLNKRLALVDLDGEPLVVVWTKTTHEIITVLTLQMYLERHVNELESSLTRTIAARYSAQWKAAAFAPPNDDDDNSS
jgi:hypothetical protein